MGFRDGTANLDAADEAQMRRHVWVGRATTASRRGRSAAATRSSASSACSSSSGTGRRSPSRKRSSVGTRSRARRSTASEETDIPDFADDPTVTSRRSTRTSASPTRAPRRPTRDLILRRGFSFSRGFDDAGRLDQGLRSCRSSAASTRVPRGAATPRRRAARGVHPAAGRRLLLRAARRPQSRRVPRRSHSSRPEPPLSLAARHAPAAPPPRPRCPRRVRSRPCLRRASA